MNFLDLGLLAKSPAGDALLKASSCHAHRHTSRQETAHVIPNRAGQRPASIPSMKIYQVLMLPCIAGPHCEVEADPENKEKQLHTGDKLPWSPIIEATTTTHHTVWKRCVWTCVDCVERESLQYMSSTHTHTYIYIYYNYIYIYYNYIYIYYNYIYIIIIYIYIL